MIEKEFTYVFAASFANFALSATYSWVTPLLYYFKLPDSPIQLSTIESTWLTIMADLSNAVFSIPVCHLADAFGRKSMLCAMGPILTLSWLLVLFIPSKALLFAMRAVQGMCFAVHNAIVPIYLSEVTSVKVRGGVMSFMSTLWQLGMVYIYLISLFCTFYGITWFTLAPNVILAIAFFCCPESPYWYLLKNRQKDAVSTLVRLRGGSSTDNHIIEEIKTMEDSVKKDLELSKGILRDIVFSRKDRKSFLIIEGVTMIYILVGVHTIPIYASDTIASFSGSIKLADYVTLILGVVLLLMTIPSIILADRWGRRPILLLSSAVTFIVFLAASVSLYCIQFRNANSELLIIFAFTCILIGASCNTFGIGTLQEVLVGEMFPTNARSVTSGITFTVFTAASVVSLSLYTFFEIKIGIYANFIVFAVFSASGFIMYLTVLPETKGKTFGEIQDTL